MEKYIEFHTQTLPARCRTLALAAECCQPRCEPSERKNGWSNRISRSFENNSRICSGKHRAFSDRLASTGSTGTRSFFESRALSLTWANLQNEGKLPAPQKERKGRYSAPEMTPDASTSNLQRSSQSLPDGLSFLSKSPNSSKGTQSGSALGSVTRITASTTAGPSVIAGFENLEIASTGTPNQLNSTFRDSGDASGDDSDLAVRTTARENLFPIRSWLSQLADDIQPLREPSVA